MKKQETSPANRAAAKSANESSSREAARKSRWTKHIRTRLDENASCESHDAFIPAAWIAEVCGKPAEEVICDALATKRGIGDGGRDEGLREMYRKDDEWAETRSAKSRSALERNVARDATFEFTMLFHTPHAFDRLSVETRHALYLRFARKEDASAGAFIERLAEASLAALLGKEVA